MKTHKLIYFLLGLLLGLLLCYFKCCQNQHFSDHANPIEYFYPKVHVDFETRQISVMPMRDPGSLKSIGDSKVRLEITSPDNTKNTQLINAGFKSKTYESADLTKFDTLPGVLDGNEQKFDFFLLNASGQVIARESFIVDDGVVWSDIIPTRTNGTGGGVQKNFPCIEPDGDINLVVLGCGNTTMVDVLWNKVINEQDGAFKNHCVYLEVDSDKLKFDFPGNADSTNAVSFHPTTAQTAKGWAINSDGDLSCTTNNITTTIKARGGLDGKKSPVHGFIVTKTALGLKVSGSRREH